MAGGEDRRVALLSIHPRFAEAILTGEKRVELRRAPFSDEVDHVLVYATSPVQAIIGWFRVKGMDTDRPSRIWKRHGRSASLARREFLSYFEGADSATAILIGDAREFSTPVSLSDVHVPRAPQNFCYPSNGARRLLPSEAGR